MASGANETRRFAKDFRRAFLRSRISFFSLSLSPCSLAAACCSSSVRSETRVDCDGASPAVLKGFASVSVPLIEVRDVDVDDMVIEKSISVLAFAAGGVGGIDACLAESFRGVVSFWDPTCFGIS